MTEYRYGFKILDPTGCTNYKGKTFQYNLPGHDEKWSLTEHPCPAEPDERSCGPGRLHVHNQLSFRYGPKFAWVWYARYTEVDIIGADTHKTSVARVELRRIDPRVLARALRSPFNWGYEAYLIKINLIDADLRGANLHGANLTDADLRGANLTDADLRGAYMTGANLSEANLSEANLSGAYLTCADLSGAYLTRADLTDADLSGAYLTRTDLSEADLNGAYLTRTDLTRTDLSGADLSGTDLLGANLRGATYDDDTVWPAGFDYKTAIKAK